MFGKVQINMESVLQNNPVFVRSPKTTPPPPPLLQSQHCKTAQMFCYILTMNCPTPHYLGWRVSDEERRTPGAAFQDPIFQTRM